MMKIAAAAMAVLATASAASAATISWVGYGPDNLWSTALNWNTNSVPGATDDVVFHNGTCVANNFVAINSLTMGDRLESKAILTIMNSFTVASTFESYQNGNVLLTSGASALNGVFTLKGGFTFQSGSVSGTVVASGASDLSGAAAKTITSGSLTLSGSSQVGGVISLDGTNPSFVVSGTSDWNNIHIMPTQKATGAQFDASAGTVNIDSDVSIQANGKFGNLAIVNKANLTIYSNVAFSQTLNIPNNSWVFTIGAAQTSALISGGGNFVAGGASTSFGAINFAGMLACTGVACSFGGQKSYIGNLVASNGALKVHSGTALTASLFSISQGQVTINGAVSVTELNFLNSGSLVGNIQAVNIYAKTSNPFNLGGAVSASKAANFAGASFSFLPAGSIHLGASSTSQITGTLTLSGPPTAIGFTNNGALTVSNAVTSTNINFQGTGSIALSSAVSVSGAQFGAGTVTMTQGSSVTGRNACVNAGSFAAGTVKAKIDAVSFQCSGACTNVVAGCSPMPADNWSFSA